MIKLQLTLLAPQFLLISLVHGCIQFHVVFSGARVD